MSKAYKVGLLVVGAFAVSSCDLPNTRKRSPSNQARADGYALIEAARMYRNDHQRFPTNVAEMAEGEDAYLTKHVLDPWGQEYMLFMNATNQLLILSRGPDGKLATDDDIVAVK